MFALLFSPHFYYRNLQYLKYVIIIKTKVFLPGVYVTLSVFVYPV